MKISVAVLIICLAGIAPTAAAPAAQPLSISHQAESAQATRLPAYDPSVPIQVSVRESAAVRPAAVRIDAAGPGGGALHVPLTRRPDGTFAGTLALASPGTWRLQLTSRSGSLDTTTAPVSLDVQTPPPSNAGAIGLAVGAGMFVVFGGGGFLLLVRKPAETRGELQQAA
jgi:hypothetical protein